MQASSLSWQTKLTAVEVASVAHALAQRASERGTEILGAQLGLLISQAIHPKSVRELGGLRVVTEGDLHDLVQLRTVSGADHVYEIKGHVDPRHSPPVPEEPHEVAGLDLWRYFSNPNIACKLGGAVSGSVVVCSVEAELPEGYTHVDRLTSDDYRGLARKFSEQLDEPARGGLLQTLEGETFYDEWIAGLKGFRTPQVNLLRQWETLRAEHVAKRLHDALAGCGIDDARVAEVVSMARPSAPTRRPTFALQTTGPINLRSEIATSARRDGDDVAALRRLLHEAIDLMSAAELREIRLSAGTMHEASRRARA